MYIYYLREFASANERHLDSSALGRWIPRPVRRQSKAIQAVGSWFWDWGFLGLLDDAFFFVEKIDFLKLCSKYRSKKIASFKK